MEIYTNTRESVCKTEENTSVRGLDLLHGSTRFELSWSDADAIVVAFGWINKSVALEEMLLSDQ